MKDRIVLIFLVSLFAFCQGNPECGPEQCNDLWTAKKCDKIQFCIAEHWSKLKPTGNRDNVCDICLRMVKEARDTLQSNETREQLLEVFEGSCRLLVLKPAVEVCDKIVDQFVPELVEILSSEMDPEIVCSVAKLCNNEVLRTAQKNSKECANCEKFTEAATEEMKTVSPEEFRSKILNLCRRAGSFSDACSHFGLEYSDLLYNNSKIILSRNPCEASLVCPSGFVNSQLAPENKKKICPLCVEVMANIREQLLRVKSAEEFSENILSVCGRIGFSDSHCSIFSNPSLFETFKTWDTLPNALCKMIYCQTKSEEGDVPFWPLVPAHNESFSSVKGLDALEFLENIQIFFPVVEEPKTEIPRPVISYGDPIENPVFFAPGLYITELADCETCTDVLDTLLNSTKADEGFSAEKLNTVCDKIQNKEMCKRFVDNFSPLLTKAYAEGVMSRTMCEYLVPSCKAKQNNLPQEELSLNNTCNLCLNLVRPFKLGDSDSWNRVLKEKCSILPENLRDMCRSTLAQLPSVLKNRTENEICRSVQLCQPSSIIPPSVRNAQETHLDQSYCQTCLNYLQELSDMLKEPMSTKVIEIIFHSLCDLLPYEEGKLCHSAVEIIGVDELKKLISSINPAEICFKIHMCPKKELDLLTIPDISTQVTSIETSEKVPCKVCLMVVKTLMDQLQNDKTEEAIRKALNNLCKYLPEETRDTCQNLIDEYSEDLIDMIIADFNATEICVFLKICPARHLLGDTYEKDRPTFDIKTNEVRDENSWKSNLDMIGQNDASISVDRSSEEDLQRFRKFVQECALCEALVGVISTHDRMWSKNYNFSANAHYICSIVPRNKRKMCLSMVVSYGPSIVNLLVNQKVDRNEVCVRVDLCDPKMQAKVNLPVSVVEDKFVQRRNDCLLGPVFWCANAENAEKCGTFLHCQETVWKNWENSPKRPTKL